VAGHATVYYKPGCPFGLRLRAALRAHRVPYVAISFRDDEAGAAQVRAVNAGNEISPTVRVGDVWLTNPRWRQVATELAAMTQVRRGTVPLRRAAVGGPICTRGRRGKARA